MVMAAKRRAKPVSPAPRQTPAVAQVAALVRDVGEMIDASRRQVALAANAGLTTLYWHIGCRVRTVILEGRRAEYGEKIVAAVGRRLEPRYGRGFGEKNLRRML